MFELRIAHLTLPRSIKGISAEVVAKDNNGFSGSKEGRSNMVFLRFPDIEEMRKNRIAAMTDWIDAFLILLGDDLEAQLPTSKKVDAAWINRWAQVTERLKRLLASVDLEKSEDKKRSKTLRSMRDGIQGMFSERELVRERYLGGEGQMVGICKLSSYAYEEGNRGT